MKNELLRRNAMAQASQASELISKPKGSVGGAGFSLITEMKLDKKDPQDKTLYNDILVCSGFSAIMGTQTHNVAGICPCTCNPCRNRSWP